MPKCNNSEEIHPSLLKNNQVPQYESNYHAVHRSLQSNNEPTTSETNMPNQNCYDVSNPNQNYYDLSNPNENCYDLSNPTQSRIHSVINLVESNSGTDYSGSSESVNTCNKRRSDESTVNYKRLKESESSETNRISNISDTGIIFIQISINMM